MGSNFNFCGTTLDTDGENGLLTDKMGVSGIVRMDNYYTASTDEFWSGG
jgi:hypothetical protein